MIINFYEFLNSLEKLKKAMDPFPRILYLYIYTYNFAHNFSNLAELLRNS